MNALLDRGRRSRLLRFALVATIALLPSVADAGLPTYTVAPPTNLKLSLSAADCAAAPLSTTGSTAAQCQAALSAGKDALVTWTWTPSPCGASNCSSGPAYNFALYGQGKSVQVWVTYPQATSNFASLIPTSLLTSPCSTLQAGWYYSQDASVVLSAMSAQACVQIPPTPAPTATPRPVHTPPLHCVGAGESNPNHLPECM